MTSFISPHCVSAYLICKKQKKNSYLLIRRSCDYLNGSWQMVSGKIEPGETAWQAALRELQEETGLTPNKFFSADIVETFYLQNSDKVAFVPVFVGFIDNPEKPRLEPTEHDAYEWLSFEEAFERLLFLEQKRIITHVQNYFVLREPPAHLLISQV
jgi:dihydroneopterin triphosphate diphosphatase